ncbi:hypothetical protein ACFXKE_02135 [Streptomyces sp. NPDC059202]|uniref:protein kinase domain-containing protein n=1 Tax=unclassified Streptomyces TaxID=2593676 RepID=UPI003658966E
MVALKVIRDEITGHPEALARFRREAATVRGPHTAQLVEASLDEAPYWLAIEFVLGPTLRQATPAQEPFDATACRKLFGAFAVALEGVHAYGATHRDLKPQNVILAAEGPRLIEFCIARGLDDTALTRTGAAPGTRASPSPRYCSATRRPRPPFGDAPAEAVSHRAVHEDIDLPEVPLSDGEFDRLGVAPDTYRPQRNDIPPTKPLEHGPVAPLRRGGVRVRGTMGPVEGPEAGTLGAGECDRPPEAGPSGSTSSPSVTSRSDASLVDVSFSFSGERTYRLVASVKPPAARASATPPARSIWARPRSP